MIFKERVFTHFAWTPSQRVKNFLTRGVRRYTCLLPAGSNVTQIETLSCSTIVRLIKESNFSVDFANSSPRTYPKKYRITFSGIEAVVEVYGDSAVITKICKENEGC